MNKINIKARIKRNRLDILAGDNFRSENSEMVNQLKNKGKDAILGIATNDEVYTIIGKDKVL